MRGPGARRRARAGVAALAVDHHRAGLDDLPHPDRRRGAERDRGAEVVARHVVVHVGEVDAEPDLRRQVHDGTDASCGGHDPLEVADVRLDERYSQRGQACPGCLASVTVDVCAERVEHAHLVTGLAQPGHDTRADEARSPRHEHRGGRAHGPSPGVMTSTTRPASALTRAASSTARTCTASRGLTGIAACGSAVRSAAATSR